MWCLETIVQINQEASRLAREGQPERDALCNVGITILTDMPAEEPAEKDDDSPE
jgi:hypothetical protein